MTRWFVATLFLSVIAPPARAQSTQLNLWTQCAVTPFLACVHAELSTLYYPDGTDRFTDIPGGVTEIRFQLENLDGRPGYDSDPYAAGLKGFNLYGLENQTSTTPFALSRIPLRTASEGNTTQHASMDTYSVPLRPDGLFSTLLRWDLDSFFFGCDVPQGASPFGGYDATCKGSITYSMFVSGELLLTENSYATLDWSAYQKDGTFAGGFSGSASCTTGVDCITVTPEPTTMLLVGTGLSVAAFMRRRKRRSA